MNEIIEMYSIAYIQVLIWKRDGEQKKANGYTFAV